MSVLQPFYRCYLTLLVEQECEFMLSVGRFCPIRVLLRALPCWWQFVHLDYGEVTRVSFNGFDYAISVPYSLIVSCVFTNFVILIYYFSYF